MSTRKATGLVLAFTAATLFATASLADDTVSDAQSAKVHCAGINKCRGHSECKTAKSVCAGLNACKGQGYITVANAKVCIAKHGTVLADE